MLTDFNKRFKVQVFIEDEDPGYQWSTVNAFKDLESAQADFDKRLADPAGWFGFRSSRTDNAVCDGRLIDMQSGSVLASWKKA